MHLFIEQKELGRSHVIYTKPYFESGVYNILGLMVWQWALSELLCVHQSNRFRE